MKTIIKQYTSLISLVFLITIFACNKQKEVEHNHQHTAKSGHQNKKNDEHEENKFQHEEASEHEEGIHLNNKQVKAIGLELGEFSNLKINDFIKATGTLGLPPNAYSSVSAKAEGTIRHNKRFVEGNFIKKGQVIAYLENPSFIVKQQEYLEAKAKLKLAKANLNRQKTLVNANAGVSKNLEQAEAEVAILDAKTKSLAKQLSYLGISIHKLSPNSITQRTTIIAPISGYITNINIHNGMYVKPSIPLMEIITDDHLHLELDIFEKDIAVLKENQKITYTIPALGNTQYEGEVNVIGKEFDTKSKTIRVHGHLIGKKPAFFKDLFINAKIWLNDKSASAVPEAAVINDGSSSFIYAALQEKDEIDFKKIMIIPGTTVDGYTSIELLNKIPDGMKIVTKGAYYVYAQSKTGALTHEH